jgi:hypothetical protein
LFCWAPRIFHKFEFDRMREFLVDNYVCGLGNP